MRELKFRAWDNIEKDYLNIMGTYITKCRLVRIKEVKE